MGKTLRSKTLYQDREWLYQKYVREKLEAQGFTGEQLDSVYAPIGIEIGSETPAEIAISIAAQLIQIRSAKTGKRKGAHPALHT